MYSQFGFLNDVFKQIEQFLDININTRDYI
ncbi:hypothetical protein ES703_95873 [subsurface metagenome]